MTNSESQGSKKGKHAKDGGVAAAVAKQVAAGKSSNGSALKDATSNASSPNIRSPRFRPTAVPTAVPAPQGDTKYAAMADSPSMEDGFSTTSVSASTAHSSDWMRGALSSSPGNLINLMGESPPTQPSSYEDAGRLHPTWASPRAYMSPRTHASPSPPNISRRPPSLHAEGPYSSTVDMRPQPSAAAHRHTSAASQVSNTRTPTHHPPLPHQPQPHFYGVPSLDLDTAPGSGLKAGERGYHFGFDTFPHGQSDPTVGSDSVVVVGYEGGLEVYSVSKRGVEPVANLRGLRGGVYNAKILPWTTPLDGISDIYPLIAVVIHGPVLPSSSSVDFQTQSESSPGTARSSVPGSPRPDAAGRRSSQPIESYQTSVEVYSLRTHQRIDVLLEASQVPVESSVAITSHMFSPPPPSGQFGIVADSNTVAVTSGLTGECWLYRQLPYLAGDDVGFGCVAKLWTSLQRAPRADQGDESERSRVGPIPPRPAQQTPILALNGRWVAYCPPRPSSHISLRAHLPVPVIGKGPGISTVTAPPTPPSTLGTDLGISDGVMNKLMRETTQELIQGAKWVGHHGRQAWNAYWNKSPNQPQAIPRSPTTQAQPWGASYPPRQDGPQFPPTHGTPNQASEARDPGLVSVVDMEAIGTSSAMHPFATFAAPYGCSFLSFSPTGLSLFTVSSKGDVQTVWDLLRMQYTRSSPLQVVGSSGSSGPRVRQVAQYSRMTVARVVDVAWSKPVGERIAMTTERGTSHLLDMPQNAFTWPPPRTRRDVPELTGTSEPSSSAVSIASGAIGAAWGAARPLMNRSRRSSSISTGFSGSSIVDSASHGGRAIASSIGNSLGKTGHVINNLRQTAENRVALPPTNVSPTPRCAVWVSGKKRSTFFAVAAGVVRMFPSKRQRPSNWILRGMQYRDFTVPSISDDVLAPVVRHFINGDDELYLSDRDMDAGNTVTLTTKPAVPGPDLGTEVSIPQGEIESSAPYQPFHTDRRVALHECNSRDIDPSRSLSGLDPDFPGDMALATDFAGPVKKKNKKKRVPARGVSSSGTRSWAFGQVISSTELDLGFSGPAEDFTTLTDDHRALPASAMERVMQVGGDDEQIVVTTRRRRAARHADNDDDGFFEDDCEVLDFADQRV